MHIMPKMLKSVWLRFKTVPSLLRIAAYLSVIYLSYAVVLGVALPKWIESHGSQQLSKLLGRDVTIEHIAINPFLLQAQMAGLIIREQDGKSDFIRIPSVSIDIDGLRTIRTLTPTFNYLYITQPTITITKLSTKNDLTTFNFSDIVDQFSLAESSTTPDNIVEPAIIAATTTEQTDNSTPITPLIADDIQIQQADITYSDKVTAAIFHYSPVTLMLSHFDSHALLQDNIDNGTTPAMTNQVSINITGIDKSAITSDLQFQLSPLKVNGKLSVSKLKLRPFSVLIQEQIAAKLTSGEANFSTQFHLTQNNQQLLVSTKSGQLSVAKLAFNQDKQPKMTIAHVTINDISLESDKQRIQIANLGIKGIWADLVVKNGSVDLAALFTPKPAIGKSKIKRQSAEQGVQKPNIKQSNLKKTSVDKNWQVTLKKFHVTDSEINIVESQIANAHHWRLYPFSISTGPLNSNVSKPIDYKVAFHIGSSATKLPTLERGEIESNGSYNPKNGVVNGTISLAKFDIRQLQAYLTPYLNIQLSSGELATSGRFSVQPSGNSTYDGTLNLDKFKIKDSIKHQTILKWQAMAINSLNFDLMSNKLNIASIALNEPYTKIIIAKDRTTNIGDLIVSSPDQTQSGSQQIDAGSAAKEATPSKNSLTNKPPFTVNVTAIKLKQGSAYFADNSLTPNFASGIESLEGDIQHLSSSPGTKATVAIQGKIDQYAPITLRGDINPLIDKPYLDLSLEFSNVELTSVSPYAGTYAGYYIDKGQLSSTLNYRLENNKLNGDNHLVFNQLTLGKKSNSTQATNLPLKLAIALLQDRHGVIDLGLHVSGDLNKPNFNLGGIVMTALSNVITKAVTAPFSFLAGLVGSDSQLNQISFPYGIAKLNSNEEQLLKKLAQALSDRPQLKINVSGAVNVVEDSHTLAELKLQQQLLDLSQLDNLPTDLSASRLPTSGPLAEALETLFEQQISSKISDETNKVRAQLANQSPNVTFTQEQITTELHIGMYNQLINIQRVTQNELENLAQNRAQAVKSYLVNQSAISRDRIFILDSKSQLNTKSAVAELKVSSN
jgi:outer membrane protein OmpA-like peptidoglycan-associated protein